MAAVTLVARVFAGAPFDDADFATTGLLAFAFVVVFDTAVFADEFFGVELFVMELLVLELLVADALGADGFEGVVFDEAALARAFTGLVVGTDAEGSTVASEETTDSAVLTSIDFAFAAPLRFGAFVAANVSPVVR